MRYLFGNGVRVLTFLIISAVLFSSYPAGGQTTLRVAVSIPPQKYFVKKIGGDHVDVTVMVPTGAEPHTYEPKPQQLISLSKSSIYFTIGITFTKSPQLRFVAGEQIEILQNLHMALQLIHGYTLENDPGLGTHTADQAAHKFRREIRLQDQEIITTQFGKASSQPRPTQTLLDHPHIRSTVEKLTRLHQGTVAGCGVLIQK